MSDEYPSILTRCYACGNPLITRNSRENHHFPVPKSLGGTKVIPLCVPCHDLVDRTPLRDWPEEEYTLGMFDLTRAGRLMMLKITQQAFRAEADESHPSYRPVNTNQEPLQ